MKKGIKKTKAKKLGNVLLLLLLCGCLGGCGSSSDSDSMETKESVSQGYGFGAEETDYEMMYADEESVEMTEQSNAGATTETSLAESGAEGNVSSEMVNSSQKIIKRYDYQYETECFDEAYTYLKEQINAYGGYISSSEITDTSYRNDYRILYMTARIPAKKSDSFVSNLGQLGTIVRQSETAEDVTLQYSDTESRIASLETEQKRLNELLEQADSLESIIALEDRLTEVRYELESYQSQKKLYDNLISYSTIEIRLEEVNYTVIVDDSTFFSRVVSGLKSSFRDIANGFAEFTEWFIIKSPYLILWVVIILVVIKVVRIIIRKRREKKNRKRNDKDTIKNDKDKIKNDKEKESV